MVKLPVRQVIDLPILEKGCYLEISLGEAGGRPALKLRFINGPLAQENYLQSLGLSSNIELNNISEAETKADCILRKLNVLLQVIKTPIDNFKE